MVVKRSVRLFVRSIIVGVDEFVLFFEATVCCSVVGCGKSQWAVNREHIINVCNALLLLGYTQYQQVHVGTFSVQVAVCDV